MSDGRVLVVERNAERGKSWRELLEFADYEPVVVPAQGIDSNDNDSAWVAALVGHRDCSTTDVVQQLRARDGGLPIVAFGGSGAAAQNPKLEICANLTMPLKYQELVSTLECARTWRQARASEPSSFPIGSSAAVATLARLMHQVARFDSTVLIHGESGSGKELVARRVHELSLRADGPFVPINCGAIAKDLLESELFGHEKGAFTGAITQRIGRFERADGGTLFLDEIGDMSLDMQIKLLRVLQERVFERVGGHTPRRANVRIIAATHRNLEEQVAAQEFREDLYFRLNVFPIRVPPLRERLGDLPDLIRNLAREGVAEGRPSIGFSAAAERMLEAYPWPGNVRELRNLLERLSILFPGRRIEPHIVAKLLTPNGEARPSSLLPAEGLDLKDHLASIERDLICSALDQAKGTVAQAARLLRLQRTTLVEKLRKYELQPN